MKTSAARVLFACALGPAALGLLACADPPLVEAPGAQAVAVARTADAIALWDALGRAHIVDTALLKAASPALVADAPLVASRLPTGAVIVATRVAPSSLASSPLAASATPVLGGTSAVDVGGERVLVRVDKNRALFALRTTPDDEATVAAVLEVMAAIKPSDAPHVWLPQPGTVAVHVQKGVLPIDLGAVDAVVTPSPAALDIDARAAAPSPDVRAALASKSPAFTCVAAKNADVVVALPPLARAPGDAGDGENPDAFDGRLVFAAYPDGSVLVTGAPKGDPAALLGDLAKTPAAAPEGTRHTYRRGQLHAVVDQHLFAFARGDFTPIESVGVESCPGDLSTLLLRLRTKAIAPAFIAALPGSVGSAVAFIASTFDAIDVEGGLSPDDRTEQGVQIKAHIGLRAMQE